MRNAATEFKPVGAISIRNVWYPVQAISEFAIRQLGCFLAKTGQLIDGWGSTASKIPDRLNEQREPDIFARLRKPCLTSCHVNSFSGLNQLGQDMLADQSRIVFAGDSITQSGVGPNGYVTIIKREIESTYPKRNIEIIGTGISGNRVPDLLRRLKSDVLDKKPTLAIIYIGINDVWHSQSGSGTPPAAYESGLRSIISQIKGVGAGVILCTPSMIGEKTDGSNDLDAMLEQYAAISRLVASETGSRLLDLRQRFIDHLKANNPLNRSKNVLTDDGVHLNPAGHDFVARQMLEALGHIYECSADRSLMRHIVLFKFKDDAPQTAIDEIVAAFHALPNQIEQIVDYEAGTNVSPEQLDQGYTHAFVVTFRDAAGRDAYLPHPAHKAFVKLLGDRLDRALVFDFATK